MTKSTLPLPTATDMVSKLPSALPFVPEQHSVQIFDMSVWKEPASEDSAVLLGYIQNLHSNGKSAKEIAHLTGLPLTTIRRKLNMVVNSHLGRVDINTRSGKRLEVDALLTERLSLLNNHLLNCYEVAYDEEGNIIDIDFNKVAKINAQINDLLKIRMKLWHLESPEHTVSSGNKSSNQAPIVQNNNYVGLSNDASKALGDIISGIDTGKNGG